MTMLEPLHAMTHASTLTADRERTAAEDPVVIDRERTPPDGGRPRHRTAQPDSAPWSGDWLQLCHELRTPLNAILGNIELLLDGSAGPLSAPARACIGDIQVASRQLMGQLQPLLLLVQARTGVASGAEMPLDLLELIRRASADRDAANGRPSEPRRAPAIISEHIRLMIPGDPVWLGALAAALVELHAGATGPVGAMSVELELDRHHIEGVRILVTWDGFDPGALPPLSVALVDAVLQLHAGRIGSVSEMGLCLDLPTARIEPSRTAIDQGCR